MSKPELVITKDSIETMFNKVHEQNAHTRRDIIRHLGLYQESETPTMLSILHEPRTYKGKIVDFRPLKERNPALYYIALGFQYALAFIAAFIAAVCLSAFIVNVALAEEKPPVLRIVSIPGFESLPPQDLPKVVNGAVSYFNRTGIVLRFRILFEENPCKEMTGWEAFFYRVLCFDDHTRAEGHSRRFKVLTYYMTPPWLALSRGQTSVLLAGSAILCGNTGTGNATGLTFPDGRSSAQNASLILAHETCHMLCCTHQDKSPNMMHPAAQDFIPQYGGKLPVLRITKRQVKRWYVQRRKYLER